MMSSLGVGLRSLRSAFLSGAMLLGSLWLLFAADGTDGITLRRSARDLLGLSPSMKLILAGLACFFVGTILTTALEGTVDYVHRRMLWRTVRSKRRILGPIESALMPLSPKARHRLSAEALRFFDELASAGGVTVSADHSPIDRAGFAKRVIEDVLWMEGKLAGTVQQTPFEQHRSAGELRLLTAVLLPLVAIAGCFAISLQGVTLIAAISVSIAIAIVLANYGLYEYRCANSLVAHHVADGVLFTPTMESAKRLSAANQHERSETPMTTGY